MVFRRFVTSSLSYHCICTTILCTKFIFFQMGYLILNSLILFYIVMHVQFSSIVIGIACYVWLKIGPYLENSDKIKMSGVNKFLHCLIFKMLSGFVSSISAVVA